jgi:hypothetical protein
MMTWYQIDPQNLSVETDAFLYAYGDGYLHNGSGVSITRFIDKKTGDNTAYGFDAQYRDGAWDNQSARFTTINPAPDYVDVHVQTGQTRKIDRLYRDVPGIHLIYHENNADWTEDFIHATGEADDITFIMHGLDDVIGLGGGKALWSKSEAACGHNYGECFITAAGGTVEGCLYKGHFIYGFINRRTRHGTGFVYPTWITTHEWKVWWTETHKIEIEYAPHSKTGERFIFPIQQGRSDMLRWGHWWVDRQHNNKT